MDDILDVRKKVFIDEQNVPEELEIDGLDDKAEHILVYDNLKPIATGRMFSDGHIGRVAVLKEYRGSGIGMLVMQSFIKKAEKLNIHRVWLSSQCHAVMFYEKLGFEEYGNIYMDAGIEHIDMEKLVLTTGEHKRI